MDNARTIKKALELFKQNAYDLLLLDVTLPDGTGFDICKEVRSNSTIPIIFLTASDQEISIVKGLDMGGDDYLSLIHIYLPLYPYKPEGFTLVILCLLSDSFANYWPSSAGSQGIMLSFVNSCLSCSFKPYFLNPLN